MAIQFSDISAILEKVIRPALEDQVTSEATLWQIARKNFGITQWVNQTFYIPIRTSRFPGVYALPEGAALIQGKPTLTQAYATAITETGSFTITEQVLSVKDRGSVVPILTTYSQALSRDITIDLNRQLWGSGDAVLGTASGAGTNSTSLTLIPSGSSNGDITAEDILVPGQYIQIGSGNGVQVSAVSGNTVTLAEARTWSDGDTVKKVIAAGASPTPASELAGFGALFSTGAYLGVDPANYPTWKAYIDTTSGPLTLADMHTAYLKAKKIGNPKYVFMNRTLFRKYGNLLESQIRFTPKQVLGGGWIGLDYMGGNAEVVLDHFCPDSWVAFIDPKMLTIGELKPLDFLKGTDGYLLRKTGYLEYEVTAVWMGNMATFARAAHAVLKNRTA